MRRIALILALLVTACGDADTATSGNVTTTMSASTTSSATTAPVTTTVATSVAVTTVETSVPLTADGNVYTIDWDALTGPVVFRPPAGAVPYFLIHNSPPHDGFFLSVEAYTTYGPTWTGELGVFEIACTPTGSGICIHFDPDGNGPLPDLGADYLATGTAEILQADGDNFVATLSNVVFSDGSTIPGPFTVSR